MWARNKIMAKVLKVFLTIDQWLDMKPIKNHLMNQLDRVDFLVGLCKIKARFGENE